MTNAVKLYQDRYGYVSKNVKTFIEGVEASYNEMVESGVIEPTGKISRVDIESISTGFPLVLEDYLASAEIIYVTGIDPDIRIEDFNDIGQLELQFQDIGYETAVRIIVSLIRFGEPYVDLP